MKCSPRDGQQPNATPPANNRISIVIADVSELYREMLKMVIESLPNVLVLGAVGNGCQALEMVAARQPQLVLLDLQLPGINGLQSMALIREYHPATRVIIITSDDSEDVKATCLAQGAHGVISKRRLHRELRRGIAEAFPGSATSGLSAGRLAGCGATAPPCRVMKCQLLQPVGLATRSALRKLKHTSRN